MTEISEGEADIAVMSPAFIIPRLWPIILGIAMSFGSLFLPWIIVGRSNGNQEPLTPADSCYLLVVASLVCCAVLIAGFVQWRQKPPVQPVIRQVLVALTAVALLFTAVAEIVAAVIPSIGSLLRVGHFSLTWSTGEGPWLATAGFALATIGISLESIAGMQRLAPGTLVRTAMTIAFVLVLVGRNYSWFSIGWSGHHIGIPSWYIPFVGNDVRSFFIIWLIALLLQWRFPLTAYTVILTSTWTILVMILVTKTLLQSVSLRTVDHLLGPSVGKFTTHPGAGLTLSMVGVVAASVLSLIGLWQAGSRRKVKSQAAEVVEL